MPASGDPDPDSEPAARIHRATSEQYSTPLPQNPLAHLLWLLHTRLAMPVASRLLPTGWGAVGSFLGPSISDFYRRHTLEDLRDMWARAHISELQTKLLSLGGAVVMWGSKEV